MFFRIFAWVQIRFQGRLQRLRTSLTYKVTLKAPFLGPKTQTQDPKDQTINANPELQLCCRQHPGLKFIPLNLKA